MLGTRERDGDEGQSDRRRVLVAEDDDELRRLLVMSLTADGYEVAEASDGHELIRQLARLWLVDAIVSDVRMPGKSGLDVLAGFRRADWTTPFVLITAFGSDELHEEALRLGASAVVDKPFDLDVLRILIRQLAPPQADIPPVLKFGGRRRQTLERE